MKAQVKILHIGSAWKSFVKEINHKTQCEVISSAYATKPLFFTSVVFQLNHSHFVLLSVKKTRKIILVLLV